jgi:hypothetical protein
VKLREQRIPRRQRGLLLTCNKHFASITWSAWEKFPLLLNKNSTPPG